MIAEDAQVGALVPFLGAGVSIGARAPRRPDFRPTVQWLAGRIWALVDRHSEATHEREALILRQLAYHRQKEARVQLLLLTHHRRLFERYAQLLAPPAGFSLRAVELSPGSEAGEVRSEPTSVAPSATVPAEGNARADLVEAMVRVLSFGRPLLESA